MVGEEEEEGWGEYRFERRREGFHIGSRKGGEWADMDVERRLGRVFLCGANFNGSGDGYEGFCLTCCSTV